MPSVPSPRFPKASAGVLTAVSALSLALFAGSSFLFPSCAPLDVIRLRFVAALLSPPLQTFVSRATRVINERTPPAFLVRESFTLPINDSRELYYIILLNLD